MTALQLIGRLLAIVEKTGDVDIQVAVSPERSNDGESILYDPSIKEVASVSVVDNRVVVISV